MRVKVLFYISSDQQNKAGGIGSIPSSHEQMNKLSSAQTRNTERLILTRCQKVLALRDECAIFKTLAL